MLLGRKVITTDVETITYENVISVLQKAIGVHNQNASEYNFLVNYEKGIQPLQREKKFRPEIDINDIDNVANEIATFKIGYLWGNPITLVQRGVNDSGSESEHEAISLLNEHYASAGIKKKTQELARDVEISGIGYTFVDINSMCNIEDGDSPFEIDVLNPASCFIVYSSIYPDKRAMLGVSFRKSSTGVTHYTCFTDRYRFEIENFEIINGKPVEKEIDKWRHTLRSGELNPLGAIPIVEWFKSYDRMGCFERQIDDMDALNIAESDFLNAADETVQAIWHCNDVDFPTEIITNDDGTKTEKVRKPSANDWLQTYTTRDGRQPFVTPLSLEYDYTGNLTFINTKRAMILQKCNVPCRNDNSGGSTGIAMDSATGWASAEVEASMQQQIMEDCKIQEVKLVLRAIRKSNKVTPDSPLLELKYKDVQPAIKRQKSYEMTSKANFMATLLSHGFYGEHVIKGANYFDDPHQVWIDSKDGIEKYQNSVYGAQTVNNGEGGIDETKPNNDRLGQDESDQIENSPNLN